MTFCIYGCHITTVCENLKIVTINDIYLNGKNSSTNFTSVSCQKYATNVFNILPLYIIIKAVFAGMEYYFIERVSSSAGKNLISYRWAVLWADVEQSLNCCTFDCFLLKVQDIVLSKYQVSKTKFYVCWLLLNLNKLTFISCVFIPCNFFALGMCLCNLLYTYWSSDTYVRTSWPDNLRICRCPTLGNMK